jgi:hypothetical protein
MPDARHETSLSRLAERRSLDMSRPPPVAKSRFQFPIADMPDCGMSAPPGHDLSYLSPRKDLLQWKSKTSSISQIVKL